MKLGLRLAFLLFALGLAACAGVLGIKPKSQEHPFEHRKHVLKGIACVACHEGMTQAESQGPLRIPTTDKCVSCHTKPHDSRTCNDCHGETHLRQEAAMAREHLTFSHDKHVGKLGGQCVPCHAAVGKSDATQLRPTMAQCLSCHQHEKQWATRDCDGCHKDLPAERVLPASHVIHEGDWLREHGVRAASSRDLCATCHSESSCASCHGKTVPALPRRFTFDKPRLNELHPAGFQARHSQEAKANPGLCTTCHDTERFCRDCHTKENRAAVGRYAASPHPPSWVQARGGEHGRAARLDPTSCASCHGGSGEALCVGCHRVGGPGGNPHGRGFVSSLDPRRDAPCKQCHAP